MVSPITGPAVASLPPPDTPPVVAVPLDAEKVYVSVVATVIE